MWHFHQSSFPLKFLFSLPLTISLPTNQSKKKKKKLHEEDRFSKRTFSVLKLFLFMLSFPDGSDSKESACNVGDLGLILGLGRSPREGNGHPLSILAWRIQWTEEPGGVHGISKSRTGLK